MVVAASQHPPGVESHAQSIPPGVTPVQGARHAGPYRGPNPSHLDRQQQGNWPFFYMQPTQPYMPCQWPMPMPYVPYGGFPGLGYGMVLPPFPPSSYVEAPGYILPHTQLHMVDYRRMMAPHLAPAMAYQARRFRYQHTAPSGRVMVSSEVQTEPVCTVASQQACNVVTSTSESGTTDPSSVFSSPRANEDIEKGCEVLPSKMAGETCKNATVQSGGILFQSEEVRIECSRSPSAVKIMHSKETTELASNADGKLMQCNVGCAEDVVLRCFQPLPFGDDEREGAKDLGPLEDPCPDIVMVSCPSNGSVSTLEGSIVAPVEPVNSTLVAQGDPSLVKSAQDICETSKDILFKILRLPVDLQCLDELQQMEASVWSVESLMPYMPTSEWMMQNSLLTPGKPSLATVMEVPAEDPVQLNRSPAEVTPPLLEAGTVTELDGQASVGSLEFLPSTHGLANFSNAYCNELSSNLQKINDPNNWAKEQPEAHQSGERPNAPPKKLNNEMDNQSTVTSGFEQEKCAARLFPDSPRKHKVCICKKCSVKHGADIYSGSPSSKADSMKRHKVSHLTGDKVKALLCHTCKCDPEKKARYKVAAITANPKSSMIDELGEVSENDVHPLKKCSKKLYNSQNSSSVKHLEKCLMSQQSKLREQNCSCEDKASNSTSVWNKNGRSQHGDLTWERNEENLAISAMERWKDSEQRFGDEKWRGSMQVSDSESTKSGGRTKNRNKQKQCTQSLEVHRRDTRY
ncbi:bucky ball [Clarias gariepinus]|uniref:bucky ball n=1 Tax=Clarias gariepinus TaxID=13013 RepID=UPI00234C936F|nr:bucky ball [Clarias gariepinus]